MALLMRARHEEDDGQLRTARVLCGQVHLQRAPVVRSLINPRFEKLRTDALFSSIFMVFIH